ncbi:MAG: hypothetical protein JWP75_497 [Frondihabitans sp.]|nr:hypothetical protein [Frondihabitans sp.]
MKALLIVPAVLAVALATAGCTSVAKTADTSHATPAPTSASPTGPFGQALTLPIVKAAPSGKGVAWSVGALKKTDKTVTVDWSDTPSAVCGRADEIRLDETQKSVTIQLVPGKRKIKVCSSDLHDFNTTVALSAPIGTRALLQQ